ncbi:MAG: efflux RND transporter permease subunit, partial [Planctomycetes bacterium]|nr:efflux RND transporter permease subunit [Planctomycetota bacterium]
MKGLIKWFIENPIASNLLMFALLGLGLMSIFTTKQEMFPSIQPNFVTVQVMHPGATPEQVEESICVKIEEALDDLDDIKKVKSTASEGFGTVLIEYLENADKDEVVTDIKDKVDAISTFPPDAEKPVVKASEFTMPVLSVAIYGDADSDVALRRLAEDIKDEITAMKEISSVKVVDSKTYEITIELDEDKLSEFNLTTDQVAAAVRASSINISGGTLRTATYGEILIRTDRKAYTGAEFEDIVIIQTPDGLNIKLKDIAKRINDGFEVYDEFIDFNGKPAIMLSVFRVGDQSVPTIADTIKDFVESRRKSLPATFDMAIWKDASKMLEGRRTLMIKNGAMGLALVGLILALFLKLSLALWVVVGLATAMVGTFWVMPQFDQSINMMTLFSFIVALGILVDDAIVVSENVWYHRKNLRKKGIKAAKDGTLEVMVPVFLAIATTVAAFVPMMTMQGTMGQFARVVPIVMTMALSLSLVESLLILPAHLAHLSVLEPKRSPFSPLGWFEAIQKKVASCLEWIVAKAYRPTLRFAIRRRYITLCMGIAAMMLSFGLFAGGFVKFVFFPAIDGDNMVALLEFPVGTPREETQREIERIKRIGEEVVRDLGKQYGLDEKDMIKHSMGVVGTQPQRVDDSWQDGGAGAGGTAGNVGEVNIEILDAEARGELSAKMIIDEWRRRVGSIPMATELTFKADVSGSAEAVNVLLTSENLDDLKRARDQVREHLRVTTGVYDINDDMRPGKLELRPELKEEGRLLGLTDLELIRQIRQRVFGEEVAREQRGRDDVRVKIRLPEADREKIASIADMKIRLPNGAEVDFSTVAELPPLERGPSAVKRADRKRSVSVTAQVDETKVTKNEVNEALMKEYLPTLVAGYQGMSFRLEGDFEQQSNTMGDTMVGLLITMALIFSILALAFRSWTQPVVVMIAIPFGIAGAIIGHYIYGVPFSLLSSIGAMAMAGVVVNDSMIMIDFANRAVQDGVSPKDAIMEAGPRRFRAILITSLTTFAGLFPMLLEKSLQAQFLIPMAISLAFGVVFSTAIILV